MIQYFANFNDHPFQERIRILHKIVKQFLDLAFMNLAILRNFDVIKNRCRAEIKQHKYFYKKISIIFPLKKLILFSYDVGKEALTFVAVNGVSKKCLFFHMLLLINVYYLSLSIIINGIYDVYYYSFMWRRKVYWLVK